MNNVNETADKPYNSLVVLKARCHEDFPIFGQRDAIFIS